VFGFITLALAAAATVALWYLLNLDVVLSWVLSITVVTFLTYGYDKAVAGSGRTRVPEAVLLTLALVGGTVGAIAGMLIFRHKTAKWSFILKFVAVLVAQVALLFVYLYFIKPAYDL
jgi:uncharacterized membrane protein YsdA (DUF1294 family)